MIDLDQITDHAESLRSARDVFATLPAFPEKYIIVDCLDLLLSDASSPIRTIALTALRSLDGKIGKHNEDLERVLAAIEGAPETPLEQQAALQLLNDYLLVGTAHPHSGPSWSCLELRSCLARGLPPEQKCGECRRNGYRCQRVDPGLKSCIQRGVEKPCLSCKDILAAKAALADKFDFQLRRAMRDYRALVKPTPGYDYASAYQRMCVLYDTVGHRYPAVKTLARGALMCCTSEYLPGEVIIKADKLTSMLMGYRGELPEIFIP